MLKILVFEQKVAHHAPSSPMLIEATIEINLYQSPKLIDQNLGKWMILRVLSGHFPHTQN